MVQEKHSLSLLSTLEYKGSESVLQRMQVEVLSLHQKNGVCQKQGAASEVHRLQQL